jgi:predicted ABC-type ATPase
VSWLTRDGGTELLDNRRPKWRRQSTLATHPRFQRLLHGVRILNADVLTLQKLRAIGREGFKDATAEELRSHFIESAEEVELQLCAALARGETIGVEGVLSTRKYCPLVEQVLDSGGFFGLIYIALRNAEISRQRVAGRVARGGHDVPAGKLADRWNRSVENLGWFARRASRFWVLDNSDSTAGVPPKLICEGGGGAVRILDPQAIPEITSSLAGTARD